MNKFLTTLLKLLFLCHEKNNTTPINFFTDNNLRNFIFIYFIKHEKACQRNC